MNKVKRAKRAKLKKKQANILKVKRETGQTMNLTNWKRPKKVPSKFHKS